MNKYDICTNYAEIIAGTSNTVSSAYLEATKSIEENGTKGMAYLKNFITSIENIAGKENVKDERISKSKGNIKDFQGYKNIKSAMEFLKKTLTGVTIIGDLVSIYNALEDCQPEYTDAYNKNIRLGILEYESAVYLLVTGLSMTMATKIDVVQNGYQIKIQKKSGSTFGVIEKTIHDLAKQLSSKNHKGYLEDLIASKDHVGVNTEIKESTFMESSISDTLELIDTVWSNAKQIGSFVKRTFSAIKNSLFGIIPLIRSILYLRYKKKADTIIALEEQIEFIERNIEQLNNIKGMDEAKKKEIIQKQKAVVEAYRKKAEKLRAELTEGEKDASIAIKKEDPEMKKVDDGDFILEGIEFSNIFIESKSSKSDDYKNLIDICKIITSNDENSMKEINEYINNPDDFYKNYKDIYDDWNIDKDKLSESEFSWLTLILILINNGYAKDLDWKSPLEDFLLCLSKLKQYHDNKLNINKKLLSDKGNCSNWSKELQEQWKEKDLLIAQLCFESDTYVIFITNADNLKKLKELALKNNHHIKDGKDWR